MNDQRIFKEIAVTSDSNASLYACRLWNIYTGDEILKIRQGVTAPECLAFIEDSYVVCGSKDPKVLNVWTLSKPIKHHMKISCIGPVNALAVSESGKFCIGAISSKLYLWEVSTGHLFYILAEHYNVVNCIKFDSSEFHFVSGGEDGLVIIWKIRNVIHAALSRKATQTSLTKPLHVLKCHASGVTNLCVTDRGFYTGVISVSKDKTCKVHDIVNGSCMYAIYTESQLFAAAIDHTGSYFYLGTKTGPIIKAPTNEIIKKLSLTISEDYNDLLLQHRDAVTCLSISANNLYLLSGSKDACAAIWDLTLGYVLHILKHEGPITNAFFKYNPPLLSHDNEHEFPHTAVEQFQFVPFVYDNTAEVNWKSKKKYEEKAIMYSDQTFKILSQEEESPSFGQSLDVNVKEQFHNTFNTYCNLQSQNLFKAMFYQPEFQ